MEEDVDKTLHIKVNTSVVFTIKKLIKMLPLLPRYIYWPVGAGVGVHEENIAKHFAGKTLTKAFCKRALLVIELNWVKGKRKQNHIRTSYRCERLCPKNAEIPI